VVVPADRAIAGRGLGDLVLGLGLPLGLGLEAGLDAAGLPRDQRAAVDLLHQPLPGQVRQVATDRHVGDPEALGEVAHPDAAGPPDLGQDHRLPSLRQHDIPLQPKRAQSDMDQRNQT
jgi:hypothetical protein